MNRIFSVPLGMILTCLLLMQACGSPRLERSELFTKLFGDESGTFRGVELGQPLQKVQSQEKGSPRNTDRFGYVYRLDLGGERYAMLEYMSKDSKSQENRIVNAIVVNVFLSDEGETSDLYKETEEFLRSQYGVGDGSFGEFNWNAEEKGIRVTLRLLDNKKSFSLNFVPADGF